MDTLSRLKVLINSSTPLILMETVEEARVLALLRAACCDLNLPLFEWSIAEGLVRTSGSAAPGSVPPVDPRRTTASDLGGRIAAAQKALSDAGLPGLDFGRSGPNPPAGNDSGMIFNTKDAPAVLAHIQSMTLEAVFVLKDFHRQLDDAVVARRLREVAQTFTSDRRALVMTGIGFKLPAELEKDVEYLELPLPDRKRLREIVNAAYARLAKTRALKRNVTDDDLDAICANLSGLTEEEADRAIAQAIVARSALARDVIVDVLAAKKEMLRRSGMLEFVDAVGDLTAVGGLENLKHWLAVRKGAFDPGARDFGLEPPRGVVIMGVQGCGKSLAARAIAGSWRLPLVKLDTADIFDKYIGETEKRVHKLFAVAEELAPVVLWIDEIEKVFAGSGPDSASADAGTTSRLLGAFLSWMQERSAPVFIAATSNNVTVLPPELIRKGRFDEIFFVDLPNAAERRAIFTLHLTRRKRDPKQFDLDALVAAAEGYSGAEIEAAVQASLYASFTDKQPLTTATVLAAVRDTVPLSTTRSEDIDQLRAWARERAVPASSPDARAAGK
ncbi:MAG TPA: AAA family ATPase [Terriglobales bacterium]|nr:AAA family ATPase [Terriglobales bacterium]